MIMNNIMSQQINWINKKYLKYCHVKIPVHFWFKFGTILGSFHFLNPTEDLMIQFKIRAV